MEVIDQEVAGAPFTPGLGLTSAGEVHTEPFQARLYNALPKSFPALPKFFQAPP